MPRIIRHDGTITELEPNRRPPSSGAPVDSRVVFDDMVIGPSAVYTSADENRFLGCLPRFAIQLVADQISGTSVTVTVRLEMSADERNWANKNAAAEISAAPLTAGTIGTAYGFDGGAVPGLPRGRLKIELAGTSPQAHLKIWVTGRGLA